MHGRFLKWLDESPSDTTRGDILSNIRPCSFSGFPKDIRVVLFYTIPHPVKTHANCFGVSLFCGVIFYTECGGVICHHGSWWLGLLHFLQGRFHGGAFFTILEEFADFGLHCGCQNILRDGALDVHGSMDGRHVVGGGVVRSLGLVPK